MKEINFFMSVLGDLRMIIAGVIVVAAFWLALRSNLKVWDRLGRGLSKRKIALFAETEYPSLSTMLKDSGLFKEENIIRIHKNDLEKAKTETLFLVHWNDYQDKIDDILACKQDHAALIVYAPPGSIKPEIMEKIDNKRNSFVSNFRGRLLNDILVSMITTGYKS